jgi:hypothetical protein
MTDFMSMTEEEFNRECGKHCPPELAEKLAANRGANANQNLIQQLISEFRTALPPELIRAMDERAVDKKVREVLAAVMPIGEVFWKRPVTRSLSEIELLFFAPISGTRFLDRTVGHWPDLTWPQLQAARSTLAQDRAWGTLDAALKICRAVEPIMSVHPTMTLSEAFSLLNGAASI